MTSLDGKMSALKTEQRGVKEALAGKIAQNPNIPADKKKNILKTIFDKFKSEKIEKKFSDEENREKIAEKRHTIAKLLNNLKKQEKELAENKKINPQKKLELESKIKAQRSYLYSEQKELVEKETQYLEKDLNNINKEKKEKAYRAKEKRQEWYPEIDAQNKLEKENWRRWVRKDIDEYKKLQKEVKDKMGEMQDEKNVISRLDRKENMNIEKSKLKEQFDELDRLYKLKEKLEKRYIEKNKMHNNMHLDPTIKNKWRVEKLKDIGELREVEAKINSFGEDVKKKYEEHQKKIGDYEKLMRRAEGILWGKFVKKYENLIAIIGGSAFSAGVYGALIEHFANINIGDLGYTGIFLYSMSLFGYYGYKREQKFKEARKERLQKKDRYKSYAKK